MSKPSPVGAVMIAAARAAGRSLARDFGEVENLQVLGEAGPQFHPGQSATLRLGPKNVLAAYGTLHPSTAKAFGFKPVHGAVMVAELFLDGIPLKARGATMRETYAPPALQA